MNRRELLTNSIFASVAVGLGLKASSAEAAQATDNPSPNTGDDQPTPEYYASLALEERIKHIPVFIDYLPDGFMPLVGAQTKPGMPRYAQYKDGNRYFAAWDKKHPFYCVWKEGQNIYKISKPDIALAHMFEISSDPIREGLSTAEHFASRAVDIAAYEMWVAFQDRIRGLVETDPSINQIYMPIRTTVCGLHAPQPDGNEGYSIFTNLGMAGFHTANPVGIANPWYGEYGPSEDTYECPAGLDGPHRARWIEDRVRERVGMRARPSRSNRG